MSTRWEPDEAYDPPRLEKQNALKVPPIDGVLPYDGARNPMTRSNTAYRVSAAIATPATNGIRKVYHFDGEAEWAVALEALIDPELYALDVQLPFFRFKYGKGVNAKFPKHYFDLRITLKNGFRLAVYVKNGSSLARDETVEEIQAIKEAMPASLADDMIVVNATDYIRPYRINLFDFWTVMKLSDPEADAIVELTAQETSYWSVGDLIKHCAIAPSRAFPAVQRLIARRVLDADWYSVVSPHSRVWLK